MKLSELKAMQADKAVTIMGGVAYYVGNITENDNTVKLIEQTAKKIANDETTKAKYKECIASGMTTKQAILECLKYIEVSDLVKGSAKLIGALMFVHKDDVMQIISLLSDIPVAELKKQPLDEFKKTALSCIDLDLVTLFQSSEAMDAGE